VISIVYVATSSKNSQEDTDIVLNTINDKNITDRINFKNSILISMSNPSTLFLLNYVILNSSKNK